MVSNKLMKIQKSVNPLYRNQKKFYLKTGPTTKKGIII